jgi:gamma-glutamylcyclotransferase (GGCT)/AIG2-like uncharacterized protein YtfP
MLPDHRLKIRTNILFKEVDPISMNGKGCHQVFIYGTLLGDDTGDCHWGGKVNVYTSRKATVHGKLFEAGVPYIVLDLEGTVHGKVFEIDDETFQKYDEIEGIGRHWYRRIRTIAYFDDGTSAEVWIYCMDAFTKGKELPNGQYRDWVDNGLYPIPKDKKPATEGGK